MYSGVKIIKIVIQIDFVQMAIYIQLPTMYSKCIYFPSCSFSEFDTKKVKFRPTFLNNQVVSGQVVLTDEEP